LISHKFNTQKPQRSAENSALRFFVPKMPENRAISRILVYFDQSQTIDNYAAK
jgi:hypothetical protein